MLIRTCLAPYPLAVLWHLGRQVWFRVGLPLVLGPYYLILNRLDLLFQIPNLDYGFVSVAH